MTEGISFHGSADGNIFNYGAQYGVCVTGSDNVVYQILVADQTQLQALLAELKAGRRAVEQVPQAVPLPTLIVSIGVPADGQWRVACRRPPVEEPSTPPADIPAPVTPEFTAHLGTFYRLATRAIEKPDERAALNSAAVPLGERLAGVVPEVERRRLVALGRADGPPPFLVIESEDDGILALPWELLRLEDGWPIRDGRLDLARCVPNPKAGHITAPTRPAGVHVNVCAPEGERVAHLNYEKEAYRITTALQEHRDVRVNEMGELDDFLKVVCGDDPPTVVHYSGHGGAGVLLFENEFGGEHEVPIAELITCCRQQGVRQWPRLFYLACCHGQDPSGDGTSVGVSSTAALLHREGVPQVIAHFGPVYDAQATDAEAAFYAGLARGHRTREALRAARVRLTQPFQPFREPQRKSGVAQADEGLTPFAWALLVLYHAGADYPLGLPVPAATAVLPDGLLRRRDVELQAGGRTKVLKAGFIGRRKELHQLRRRLRDGQNVTIIQGLGGLGKSVLSYKALALYAEHHYVPLALWCAAVESQPQPAAALVQQFTDGLRTLAGQAVEPLLQAADQRMPNPADRLAFILLNLLQHEQSTPLVLYLDNLESLMLRPDSDRHVEDAVAEWCDADCQRLWQQLAAAARQLPHKLALLASCRYRHARDFPRADTMSFARMPDDTVFRMLEWFPALGRLSPWTRARLVPLLHGHPRAAEFLDGFVGEELRRYEDDQGPPPPVENEDMAAEEWARFVEPILEATQQKLQEDLLFEALWTRVLRPADRRLLVRLSVLRRPADRPLVDALADPAGKGQDLRRSRDTSLVEETVERDPETGREELRFEGHPVVAELARPLTPQWDAWRQEGYRLAGEFHEQRLKTSHDGADAFDGGFYLVQAGEADRGFELLGELAQWLAGRGRNAEAAVTLASLLATPSQSSLSPRYRAILLRLWAGCLVRMGNLEAATKNYMDAAQIAEKLARQDPGNAQWQYDLGISNERVGDVLLAEGDLEGALRAYRARHEIIMDLADKDPGNAEWQRDLSVSYNKLGQVQQAQGDLAGALASYRQSLTIREKLARQDPGNAEWQADVVASLVRMSSVFDLAQPAGRQGAREALQQALSIAQRIQQTGSWTGHEQKGWVDELKRRLVALDESERKASSNG
jgi:tetratricopeptide (TPR) repeat protein